MTGRLARSSCRTLGIWDRFDGVGLYSAHVYMWSGPLAPPHVQSSARPPRLAHRVSRFSSFNAWGPEGPPGTVGNHCSRPWTAARSASRSPHDTSRRAPGQVREAVQLLLFGCWSCCTITCSGWLVQQARTHEGPLLVPGRDRLVHQGRVLDFEARPSNVVSREREGSVLFSRKERIKPGKKPQDVIFPRVQTVLVALGSDMVQDLERHLNGRERSCLFYDMKLLRL